MKWTNYVKDRHVAHVGGFDIIVARIPGRPGRWLSYNYPDLFGEHELKSTDLDEAKAEAVELAIRNLFKGYGRLCFKIQNEKGTRR